LIGGLGLLLPRLLLLLLILLLAGLLTFALISASESAEQRTGGGPDRGTLAGISGNRTADRAQRRTSRATTYEATLWRFFPGRGCRGRSVRLRHLWI
jgi:hypothetical protein